MMCRIIELEIYGLPRDIIEREKIEEEVSICEVCADNYANCPSAITRGVAEVDGADGTVSISQEFMSCMEEVVDGDFSPTGDPHRCDFWESEVDAQLDILKNGED